MFRFSLCSITILLVIACGHGRFSREEIDSFINDIDHTKDKKSITSIDSIDHWDAANGHSFDTAVYVFTFEPKTGGLLKVNYEVPSSKESIVFYYQGEYLIAARINSEDFPSWKNSFHYFQNKSSLKEHSHIVRATGSETENDVREFLLFEGYSNINYYNTSVKSKK